MVWQNKGRKFFDVELEVGYDMPRQGDVEIQRMGQHFDKPSIALVSVFKSMFIMQHVFILDLFLWENYRQIQVSEKIYFTHTKIKKWRKEKRMQGGKLGKEGRQKGGSSNKNKQSQKVKPHCHFNWPDLLRNNEVLKVLESLGYYAIESFPLKESLRPTLRV